MEKMYKYKMVDNNKCKRCGEVETYMHLLWECREAKRIWEAFNELLTSINKQEENVVNYEEVYKIGKVSVLSKVKIKIIQQMIQIERPTNWTIEEIKKIANEIKGIEMYNARKVSKVDKIKVKWEIISKFNSINNN